MKSSQLSFGALDRGLIISKAKRFAKKSLLLYGCVFVVVSAAHPFVKTGYNPLVWYHHMNRDRMLMLITLTILGICTKDYLVGFFSHFLRYCNWRFMYFKKDGDFKKSTLFIYYLDNTAKYFATIIVSIVATWIYFHLFIYSVDNVGAFQLVMIFSAALLMNGTLYRKVREKLKI